MEEKIGASTVKINILYKGTDELNDKVTYVVPNA